MFFFGILDWITYLWWLWLFLLAWFYFSWARNHLPFSSLLGIIVGVIFIYYLVILHPLVGSLGFLFSIVFFTGVIWLLPVVVAIFRFRR